VTLGSIAGKTAERREGTVSSERLTASIRSVRWNGRTLTGEIQLVVRALSGSIEAFHVGSGDLRFSNVKLGHGQAEFARIARGLVRTTQPGLRIEDAARLSGPLEIDCAVLPNPAYGISAHDPLRVHGNATVASNRLGAGSDISIETPAAARVTRKSLNLATPSGFVARLVVPRGGKRRVELVAPDFILSEATEPRLHVNGLSLSVEPMALNNSGVFAAPQRVSLRAERARFRTPEVTVQFSAEGEVSVERSPSDAAYWLLSSGRISLPTLTLQPLAEAEMPIPLSAELQIRSGAVVVGEGVSIDGSVALSGQKLSALLDLVGMPDSVHWMLSRFVDQPFQLSSPLRRDPVTLWLRDLQLTSGALRIEGALRQVAERRAGVLLVLLRRAAVGVRFDEAGSAAIWGADRDWLREQMLQLKQADTSAEH
jgi:hypothetical protein